MQESRQGRLQVKRMLGRLTSLAGKKVMGVRAEEAAESRFEERAFGHVELKGRLFSRAKKAAKSGLKSAQREEKIREKADNQANSYAPENRTQVFAFPIVKPKPWSENSRWRECALHSSAHRPDFPNNCFDLTIGPGMVRAVILMHEPRQARIAGQAYVRRTLRAIGEYMTIKGKLFSVITLFILFIACKDSSKPKDVNKEQVGDTVIPDTALIEKLSSTSWVPDYNKIGMCLSFFDNQTVYVLEDGDQFLWDIDKYQIGNGNITIFLNKDKMGVYDPPKQITLTIKQSDGSNVFNEALMTIDNRIIAWNKDNRKKDGSCTFNGLDIELTSQIGFVQSTTHFYNQPTNESGMYFVVLEEKSEDIRMRYQTMEWMADGKKQIDIIGTLKTNPEWLLIYNPFLNERNEYLEFDTIRSSSFYCWVRKEEVSF